MQEDKFDMRFRATYPIISKAIEEGEASPNETWLRGMSEKAFAAGLAAATE
jgi:hypothetical protein